MVRVQIIPSLSLSLSLSLCVFTVEFFSFFLYMCGLSSQKKKKTQRIPPAPRSQVSYCSYLLPPWSFRRNFMCVRERERERERTVTDCVRAKKKKKEEEEEKKRTGNNNLLLFL